MDSQDFVIIRKTYETGSLSKAAQALYLSPQALSKRIKKIELELGTTLFERTSTGMIPTNECKRFYEQSDAVFSNLNHFLESFKEDVSLRKTTVTVASTLGVLALITPERIHAFRTEHPEIDLHFIEYSDSNVESSVRDGKSDFGLIIGPVDPKNFSSISLLNRQFCVLTRPGTFFGSGKYISVEELRGIPIAIENKEFKAFHIILSACHTHGFHPQIYFETTEINFAHSIARSSDCVAISVFDDAILHGTDDLDKKLFRPPLYWEVHAIIRNGETFNEASTQVLDFISTSLAEASSIH